MRCTKCEFENPIGMKFCGQCTAPLALICPNCRFENPPGFKFCGQCTAPLQGDAGTAKPKSSPEKPVATVRVAMEEASPTLEGERKTVTALFADIKGSTELEQGLDPEEARAIIDPALKLMIDAVRRYDGYIVQSTGDGIFALFGAPVAHEDHPQRALYAALRMQEDLKRYSAKLVADGGMPIEARIGANTGEVVVRSISTGGGHVEYTPIGHTTNLASRMQAVAPTGSIATSEQTRKFVEGYFQLKPMGPTRVKGVSEPVNVYEVTGLGPIRTRLQRSAGRGYTKFVGREREMEALKHAAGLAREGHGQIAAAVAEAGTGKSRLFFEFKAVSQSGWMVLEAFSVSHGKASAYLPVIDLLHGYFGIDSDDDARRRRERVAGKIVILDRSLEDTLPYLYSLLAISEVEDPLSAMDAQVRRRRTLDAIKRILLRESLNQPLMVIFEDLHWIDDETQALLNLLADSIGTAKLLLLVNYRPEYSHQWNSKTYYTQLRLDPLGKESAGEMLSALLGDGPDLQALKRVIIERTEGNPFFMEETVQVLLDEGALVRDGTEVRLTKALGELKIPPTVQAILAARIDRLPAAEKDLLQTLAVIGKEFQLSLVRAVVSASGDELARMLDELQLGEFIYEQPAVGDVEYTFKHALTQEVAYNSILGDRRKLLHERIGAAIETLYAASIEDHLSELAHHYARSGNADKAAEYLQRAGLQAFGRSAHREALDQLSAALEFLGRIPESPQRDDREAALQLARASAIQVVNGIGAEGLDSVFSRIMELSERTGNARRSAEGLGGLQLLHLARAEYDVALRLAHRLLEMAQAAGDPMSISWAQFAVGQTHSHLGEFTAARSMLEQAASAQHEEDRSRLSSIDRRVISRLRFGQLLVLLGYPDQGLKMSSDTVAMARDLSRPFDLVIAMMFLGNAHLMIGDRSSALGLSAPAIELVERNGLSAGVMAAVTFDHGYILATQGQTEGLAQMEQGITGARAIRTTFGAPWMLGRHAQALQVCGRSAEAGSVMAEALELAQKTGEGMYLAELHRIGGELGLAQASSDASQAERRFRTAIEIARRQSAKWWELRATVSLASLLAKQGKRAEARAMLAEIYNWFTEGFDTGDLKDAKVRLDELGA